MPGRSAGRLYRASPLVVVSRVALVWVLVTVMFAPGSTAPAWSTTRPLMLAVAWPNAAWLAPTSTHATMAALRIVFTIVSPHVLAITTNDVAGRQTGM